MKTQFTPAPWKSDTYAGSCSESLYVTSEKGIIIGVGQYDISGTGKETASKQEGQANGFLIAAAPDLFACVLEAIKDQQTAFRVMSEANQDMGFPAPKKPAWVERAEAAIDKAVGK